MANFIKIHTQRAKKTASLANTLIGSFRAGYKVQNSDQDSRELLPKYIQTFCRKINQSFGIKVVPVEPTPQTHGLWVGNHTSWLDISVIGCGAPIFFLAKSEIGDWPIMGKLIHLSGTLLIKRGSGDTGSVADQIADFLSSGASVIFFPEATTTNGHKIKSIHGKLLQSAMKAQVPIQPIVVCYANSQGVINEDAAYCGKMTMIQSVKKVLDTNDIIAYTLPLDPIHPEDKTQDQLTEILAEKMQQGLTKLQKQVLSVKPSDAIWD